MRRPLERAGSCIKITCSHACDTLTQLCCAAEQHCIQTPTNAQIEMKAMPYTLDLERGISPHGITPLPSAKHALVD